jgi:DNA polymerase-3 subunit epsilon
MTATALDRMDVLVVDCQATSSRPDSGFLLEVGWLHDSPAADRSRAELENDAESILVRPPRGAELPRRVQQITGITVPDLKQARPGREAWRRLRRQARRTAESADTWPCPTVIHFGRYEEAHLSKLHADWGRREGFPLQILCTHSIIRRLYPGLPRKGLRAVLGYFGFSMPELRRSRHHVAATSLIWRHLLPVLKSEHSVETLKDLTSWLGRAGDRRHTPGGVREYPMDRALINGVPDAPGVYRMYRLNGDILYVGKAKSLKRRVNSYFRPRNRGSEHILEMLSQAKDLTYTTTRTALEASVLESDEIKRLSPPFNRALKRNGREVCYLSPDLRSHAPARPDPGHPVGPLPSPLWVAPLGHLSHLLTCPEQRVSGGEIEQVLGGAFGGTPGRRVFQGGLRMFRESCPELQNRGQALADLLALGARLWREKLEEEAAARDRAEEEPEDTPRDENEPPSAAAPEDPPLWTEERVARILRSLVRQGAFLLRRTRWFLRLYDSILVWPDRQDAGVRHTAVIRSGRILFPDGRDSTRSPGASSDPPAGPTRDQRLFDIAAYDRLRVLTTEIRRLVDEGRDVELSLGPEVRLDRGRLAKMLPWV